MDTTQPRYIFSLLGPTASGKTDIALELADRFQLSLISVDSAMIYRGMDIGTAKPSRATLAKFPHALIDILDPEVDFSVGDFVAHADRAVKAAFEAGRIPLLVGGTMLYFKGFREGLAQLPGRNSEIREELRIQAHKGGVEELHADLVRVDPESAHRIHPNNYSRIERALEIFRVSGIPMSTLLRTRAGIPITDRMQCKYLEFSLQHISREELHRRIERRLSTMLEEGFVQEVGKLMQRPGLSMESMSMRAVGYRHVWSFLETNSHNAIDTDTIESIKSATRQLARRQLTWLRSWRHHSEHYEMTSSNPLSDLFKVISQCVTPKG